MVLKFFIPLVLPNAWTSHFQILILSHVSLVLGIRIWNIVIEQLFSSCFGLLILRWIGLRRLGEMVISQTYSNPPELCSGYKKSIDIKSNGAVLSIGHKGSRT